MRPRGLRHDPKNRERYRVLGCSQALLVVFSQASGRISLYKPFNRKQ
jgi:hypothetical protein